MTKTKLNHSIKLLLFAFCIVTVSCNLESLAAVKQSLDANTVWVFAQINVPEKEGFENYYYYGRINEAIYHQMIDGEVDEGFILFRDVRYWSNNDKIEKYEDNTYSGDLVFRIDHIVKLDLAKGDPLMLQESE